ncbi:MAG: TonB-dependent receptor [Alistipes sp.]|nr:TonB-dependent receptor [Alistipes sp.]
MKRSLLAAAVLLLTLPVRASLPAETSVPDIEKQPHPIDSVVVTGTRYRSDIRHLPMSVSTVDRRQIERQHEQSLLPLLTEQVPGLFATGRGIMGYSVSTGAAGQLSLRGIGGAPQDGLPTTGLMVLIDGHPQYMGLMGHPIADAYQSMLAERVEVLRGPASVLYGSNAMGGVINIVTRKMQEEGVETGLHAGYGSYNTLQTELTNRVRADRFTSVVSGSYNRTDGHRPRMGFEQYGGYAKLGYQLSRAWDIYADVNLTHFNASNPGSVTAPVIDNDSHITRGMTSFALQNDYGKTSGALSFFYNWGRHKIDDGYSPGAESLDYRFHSRDDMLGISWYQSARLFEGNRLTLGFDWFRFGGRAWNQPLDGSERTMLADKVQHEVAVYLDFRQTIASWLILDAGIRYDRHSHAGSQWVPQAGLSFLPSSNAELKISASKGFRYPTIREMYMFPPQNPDLKPERLWNYEIAWSQRLAEGRVSYGINVFYIDGANLIMRIPVDGRPKNINTGRIENAGAEAQIGWRISPAWSLDANYSYLHMKYPVLASPEHKLYAGAAFTRGRWNVSTGVQYVGGLYTSVKVNGSGTDKQENFVLWNLRGSFRVCKILSIFARGENLLAQRYEINAGYPMPKATVLGGIDMKF